MPVGVFAGEREGFLRAFELEKYHRVNCSKNTCEFLYWKEKKHWDLGVKHLVVSQVRACFAYTLGNPTWVRSFWHLPTLTTPDC